MQYESMTCGTNDSGVAMAMAMAELFDLFTRYNFPYFWDYLFIVPGATSGRKIPRSLVIVMGANFAP